MTKEQDQERIDAILEERAGLERQGKTERIKAVDAELKRLGYEFPDAPKGRSASHQQKADDSKGKEVA